MIEKIKTSRYIEHLRIFRDIRALGLMCFGLIVLLVSWSGVSVIQSNYGLQKQQARLEEQNKVVELENTNQKLRNQYFQTDQYLELNARRQFGKALPGETLVLVPRSVALANTVDLSAQTAEKTVSVSPTKPSYQRNFEAWTEFFFHSK